MIFFPPCFKTLTILSPREDQKTHDSTSTVVCLAVHSSPSPRIRKHNELRSGNLSSPETAERACSYLSWRRLHYYIYPKLMCYFYTASEHTHFIGGPLSPHCLPCYSPLTGCSVPPPHPFIPAMLLHPIGHSCGSKSSVAREKSQSYS